MRNGTKTYLYTKFKKELRILFQIQKYVLWYISPFTIPVSFAYMKYFLIHMGHNEFCKYAYLAANRLI